MSIYKQGTAYLKIGEKYLEWGRIQISKQSQFSDEYENLEIGLELNCLNQELQKKANKEKVQFYFKLDDGEVLLSNEFQIESPIRNKILIMSHCTNKFEILNEPKKQKFIQEIKNNDQFFK